MEINPDAVTAQDCVEMDEMKGASVVLNDGKVVGFIYDHAPCGGNRNEDEAGER